MHARGSADSGCSAHALHDRSCRQYQMVAVPANAVGTSGACIIMSDLPACPSIEVHASAAAAVKMAIINAAAADDTPANSRIAVRLCCQCRCHRYLAAHCAAVIAPIESSTLSLRRRRCQCPRLLDCHMSGLQSSSNGWLLASVS